MKRREAMLGAFGCLALSAGTAGAESVASAPVQVGWMTPGGREGIAPVMAAFAQRMQVRGWTAGRDFFPDCRPGDGDLLRLPDVARALVAQRPSVIVSSGSSCALALQRATRAIPIVAWYAAAPVELGLVASNARPGGNITAITANQLPMAGKLVEMLCLANPRIRHLVLLRNPDHAGIERYSPYTREAARRLGIRLTYMELRSPSDLALRALQDLRPDALYVVNDFVTGPLQPVLLRFAREHKLATIGVEPGFVHRGGLLSLGPDPREMFGNLAEIVDHVLRGTPPASIPVREPSRYWFAVNRGTARAIGLELSQEVLLRANEVVG